MLADLTWPPSTASTGNAVTYVLAHRGDHDAVLERLSTCSAVTTLGERTARPKYAEWWDMRRLYGFSEDHWSRQHGARRDVRVAVCLATDLIWLGYSDGLLAARNVVRLRSNSTAEHSAQRCTPGRSRTTLRSRSRLERR